MQIQQNIFTKQEEGWIAMRTDLRKYLVNTTQTNRDILDHLMDCGAFDKTKAKTIKELAEALQLHPKYIGPALKEMSASGWLLKYKESRFVYYYANNERVNGISPTVLPEKVFTKVEPVTCKTKATGDKKTLERKGDLAELIGYMEQVLQAYNLKPSKGTCINLNKKIKEYGLETCKRFIDVANSDDYWKDKVSFQSVFSDKNIEKWQIQLAKKNKEEMKVERVIRNIGDEEVQF